MIRSRKINPLISKKVIAENLLQQICLANNDFVLKEIELMDDAQLILFPLVENGMIEYRTDRPYYDHDPDERTVIHHLNILEFLVENKRYSPILEAVFSNPKTRNDIEQQNSSMFAERESYRKYRRGFPEPKGYFMLNDVINFVFSNNDNFSDKKHVFTIINNHYSLEQIVFHMVGSDPDSNTNIKELKASIKEKISLFSYEDMNAELSNNPRDNNKKLKV